MPDNISKYNNSRTHYERSEQARQAGKASGRARRANAKLIRMSKSPAVLNHLDKIRDESTISSIADAVIRSALRGKLSAVRFILNLEDSIYREKQAAEQEPEFVIEIIRHSSDEEVEE